MQPADTPRPSPARRSRLAVPIAVGLLLFLGGPLVQSLPQAMKLAGDPQGYTQAYVWASVASLVVRYGGALLFTLTSVTLAFRLCARRPSLPPGVEAPADETTRGPGRAMAAVIGGLLLLAAAEASEPLLLYFVSTGEPLAYLSMGPWGTVTTLLMVSAFIGPVLTAVGALLMSRRLE